MTDEKHSFPLRPGSSIGILGSGQLARMLATAAARLGLRCKIYADAPGPAFDVAAAVTVGAYDAWDKLTAFAGSVSVVTYEFENVADATAQHLAKLLPVRPGPKALAVAQDRLVEKTFLSDLGIAIAPFTPIASVDDLKAARPTGQNRAILKTRRLGYDGKGQVPVDAKTDPQHASAEIGHAPAVLEQRLTFQREVSVLICRSADGSDVIYDIPDNTHRDGILRRSTVPSALPDAVVKEAHAIARRIATALNYVGLLAVELFDLGNALPADQRLVVNEIAPRVHNSGHWTLDACVVSQFENHMRAVAGWPLGSAIRHSDAVMENLIGADALAWRDLAAETGCCLHLYGKHEARAGRKMGHVTRLTPRR